MIHSLVTLALCLACILAGGCIHLEQRVKINPNGSGIVTYDYSVAEETYAAAVAGRMIVGEWQNAPRNGLNWFTNETAVKQFFAGQEFELQYYRVSRKGARRHVHLVLLAPDLQAALATGKLGDFRLDQTANGDGRFRHLPPAKPGPERPLDDQEVAKLRALCDDLWLQLVVETPGDVLEASSADREGRQVTWTFDPGRNDAFLRKRPVIEVVYKRKD